VRCRPLVATRASDSPWWDELHDVLLPVLGSVSSAVSGASRHILLPNDRVKCRIQTLQLRRATGTSCLHPELASTLIVPKRVVLIW